MINISDEYMREMLTKTKEYSIVLLKPGPNANDGDIQGIIWEHARRNFALRAEGSLAIVAPITEETSVNGLYIFNATREETKKIIEGDPAVQAGIFIYEIHPCRSFPGDRLS